MVSIFPIYLQESCSPAQASQISCTFVLLNRIWFVIGGQHSPTGRTKQLSVMSCSITHLMRHFDPVIWELQLPNRKTQISVHTHLCNTFGQIPWKNTTCSNSCNFNQYLWLLSIKCILNLRRQNDLPVFCLFLVLPDLVLFIFLLVPDICCVNLRLLFWYTVTVSCLQKLLVSLLNEYNQQN